MTDDQVQEIDTRFDAGEARMNKIEETIVAMRESLDDHIVTTARNQHTMMRAIEENTGVTKDIKAIVDMGRALFRLAGWIGAVAKWFTPVASAIGLVWAWMHRSKL